MPLHRHNTKARWRSRQCRPMQSVEALCEADPAKARRRLHRCHPLSRRTACRHSHLCPCAPLHAPRGSAARQAMGAEHIEACVGGRVVGLPGSAEQRGD